MGSEIWGRRKLRIRSTGDWKSLPLDIRKRVDKTFIFLRQEGCFFLIQRTKIRTTFSRSVSPACLCFKWEKIVQKSLDGLVLCNNLKKLPAVILKQLQFSLANQSHLKSSNVWESVLWSHLAERSYLKWINVPQAGCNFGNAAIFGNFFPRTFSIPWEFDERLKPTMPTEMTNDSIVAALIFRTQNWIKWKCTKDLFPLFLLYSYL